jgi:hypothetical protein
MQAQSDFFEGALSFADSLPLAWHPGAAAAEGIENDRLSDANLRLLSNIAQLEERTVLGDEPTQQEMELARLHAKMDVVLELLGALVPRYVAVPPRVALHLSWQGVAWHSGDAAFAVGQTGAIEIYLHPTLLQPLRWPARIARIDGGWVAARFLPLAHPCQQALERHVFKHHRRAVAERRGGARNQ